MGTTASGGQGFKERTRVSGERPWAPPAPESSPPRRPQRHPPRAHTTGAKIQRHEAHLLPRAVPTDARAELPRQTRAPSCPCAASRAPRLQSECQACGTCCWTKLRRMMRKCHEGDLPGLRRETKSRCFALDPNKRAPSKGAEKGHCTLQNSLPRGATPIVKFEVWSRGSMRVFTCSTIWPLACGWQ